MGLRGFGSRRAVEMVMSDNAATAVDSWKTRKFWILRKILLPVYGLSVVDLLRRTRCVPSSTAGRRVAKLSSTRITSAASLATSVPPLPIDTPMSAIRNAGASFTLTQNPISYHLSSLQDETHLHRQS